MKLEIKHLAPYLPYGLYCFAQGHIDEQEKPIPERILGLYDDTEVSITLCEDDSDIYCIEDIFPILRPLSDLTKEITIDGKTFVPLHKFYSLTSVDLELIDVEEWREELVYLIKNNSPFQLSQFNMLLEWHFDIFSLCDKGLAIDINTLE